MNYVHTEKLCHCIHMYEGVQTGAKAELKNWAVCVYAKQALVARMYR